MKRTNSDNVSCSYWTKRRQIKAAINKFLSCDETSGPESNEHQETDEILPEIHDSNDLYLSEGSADSDGDSVESFLCDVTEASDCVAGSSELCERDNTEDSLSISLVGWASHFNVPQVAITGSHQSS